MKKLVSVALVVLFSQFAFAQDKEVLIPAKCLNKLTQFSIHFANASMPYFGNIPVTMGQVEVNSKAIRVGESVYADGTGTYEVTIGDKGEEETSQVEFGFRYIMEPHCVVLQIQISDI